MIACLANHNGWGAFDMLIVCPRKVSPFWTLKFATNHISRNVSLSNKENHIESWLQNAIFLQQNRLQQNNISFLSRIQAFWFKATLNFIEGFFEYSIPFWQYSKRRNCNFKNIAWWWWAGVPWRCWADFQIYIQRSVFYQSFVTLST